MMISDKYKYLFMEVPHTACTSIAAELLEHYDARYFGPKHATYHQFLRMANEEQKKYFVFAGVRNPLDVAVTVYLRYRTNHGNTYEATPGGPPYRKVTHYQLNAYRYARTHDFPDYFRRYHRLPFSDAVSRDAKRFANYIIRYENLQEEFANVLNHLGIEQVRPLPRLNRTATKERDFLSYYTPDIQHQALHVFSPYMEEWGYSLPEQWQQPKTAVINRLGYRALNAIRDFYWQHVRFSDSFYGRLARATK